MTSRTLQRELSALGLATGDVVMVHAGLRSLGTPPPRAQVVLAAIQAAIGPEGTMLMMLAADAEEPFNAWTTEVDVEDMGVLAECFRRQDRVEVSDHPACRFAARGPHSAFLLHPCPVDDYYGPGSTLERLVACSGKVLRLGPALDTVTLTHLAEYLAKVPNKKRVTRHYSLAGGDTLSVHSLDDTEGIRIWSEGDYFPQILVDYLAAGHAQHGPVGACSAELLDGEHFLSFAVRWLESVFGGG